MSRLCSTAVWAAVMVLAAPACDDGPEVTDDVKAAGLYAKAQQSMAEGDFQSAAFDLKEVLKLDPDYLEARHALGECFLGMRMAEEAEAEFQAVVEKAPEKYLSWMGLGHALRLRGRFDEARQAYQRAARLKPESGEPYRYLGDVALATGDLDGALEAYGKAAEAGDGKEAAEAMQTLGEALMKGGRPADAAKAFAAAVEKGLDGSETLNRLGQARVQAGDLDGALAAFEEAAKKSDDDFMTYLLVGSLRQKKGDRKGALEAFETARKIAPESARVWEALGVYYLEAGETARAKEMAEKAVGTLGGEDPLLIMKVADLLDAVGEHLRAAELYKVAAVDPQMERRVDLWWKTARAQAKVPGQEAALHFSCMKVRELAGDDPAHAEAVRWCKGR